MRAAFGLPLEVDPSIAVPGVDGAALAAGEPTRVRLDPDELERRWRPVAAAPERVRELRAGGALLLAIDFAPAAGYLLRAPGFARVLVAADGSELLCDPEPHSSDWPTLLSAQALPLAATLRGLEVLHASGVVLAHGESDREREAPAAGESEGRESGGRAVLFTGPQGAGKSSLAAALLRRGGCLLSDDTVAVESREGRLIAHPGAALLHLREEEHERLDAGERAALGPVVPVLGKRRFTPSAIASAASFGALFLIERSSGPPVERIEAVEPFDLLASTFNLSVRTPERLTRHLDLAVALAATQSIFRLRVQPGVDATQLADRALESLQWA